MLSNTGMPHWIMQADGDPLAHPGRRLGLFLFFFFSFYLFNRSHLARTMPEACKDQLGLVP